MALQHDTRRHLSMVLCESMGRTKERLWMMALEGKHATDDFGYALGTLQSDAAALLEIHKDAVAASKAEEEAARPAQPAPASTGGAY